jgi:predicted nucleic acid-binding protein
MTTVFADSFYFFALVNDKDSAYAQAIRFLQTYQGRILTTAWVVMELGDGLSHPLNRPSFLLTVDSLKNEPNATILSFSDEFLEAGIDLYRQRPDKHWSLTDCISFVVMQREGPTDALTGDHHFEQAGFTALLK